MSTSVETKMEKMDSSFTSTFIGLSGFPTEVGVCTSSSPVDISKNLWSVKIYPGGFDEESKDYLSCFLHSEVSRPIRASFKISIVNQKGWKNHFIVSTVKAFNSTTCMWGEAKFILRNDLKSATNGICVEDKLVIKVDMTVYGSIEYNTKRSGSIALSPSKYKATLSQDLASILFMESTSDVTIIAGDERIPAHKFMLCLRSEVFKAMLCTGMTETRTNIIEISDFDESIVRELLKYIYTDECSPKALEDDCELLFAAACKYQIKGLETLCEVHMSSTINVSNVVKIAYFADLYGKKELKSCALQFIAMNAKAVIQTEGFFDSLGFTLCQEVLKVIAGVGVDKSDS
mmetsp:Transcript_4357/g.5999  ORF Transcript_4357/g.5999 Transcript_4357/m.5999 type:complete len:346 (-) Transcript_4357:327-1364(-)